MDQETHKAITVLVVPDEKEPTRYLTVCDKRWDDWTFVTGGCRKREIGHPIRTALRELEEETRGVIAISEGSYRYFYFEDEENPGIIYHVFVIEIVIPRTIQLDMVARFNREKEITEERKKNRQSIRRTYDENKYMSFDTMEEFQHKAKWPLIENQVLANDNFHRALNPSFPKIPFNIRRNRCENPNRNVLQN
jgi:ADP-ribose pyrophosphatase YjhB (NUDIX family)